MFDFSRLFAVPVGVAYHVVAALATWFAPVPGGMATAAAIIVFTVAVRLALTPLSYYMIRGEAARARLAPRVRDLQRRFARQPERLQHEMRELYQAEGAGLFAGCLPMLLQLSFLSLMYRLFASRTVGGAPNLLLTHRLFGAPLASHWLTGAGPFSKQGMVFFGLLALLGVVAWLGARTARRATAPGGDVAAPAGVAKALTRLFPYGTLLVAAVMPLAAGLYLLTTTAWTVLERAILRRRLSVTSQAA